MTRRRGTTLVEMLVVCGMLGVLMTCIYNLLIPVLNIWQTGQARAAIEQTGLVLETRMRAELVASSPASVTTLANPPAISFMSIGPATTPAGYDPTNGKPLWQQFVVYYLDTENNILYRKTWPPALPALPYNFPTTTAVALKPAELTQLVTSENGSEQRAAYYVTSITLTGGPANPFQLDLQFSTPSVGGSQATERTLSIGMSNS